MKPGRGSDEWKASILYTSTLSTPDTEPAGRTHELVPTPQDILPCARTYSIYGPACNSSGPSIDPTFLTLTEDRGPQACESRQPCIYRNKCDPDF
jgi:hypothetical protein